MNVREGRFQASANISAERGHTSRGGRSSQHALRHTENHRPDVTGTPPASGLSLPPLRRAGSSPDPSAGVTC